MQHQPDHDQPRFGDFGDTHPEPFIGAQRLSILALLSTITGALTLVACCVPAVGIVPTLLGAGGLIGISRSRGEVRGRGLAITGLLLGLFSLAVSTALWVGASSVAGQFGPVYSQAFDPDPQVVRSVLTNRAAADLTDEQVAAFQQALAEAGATGVEIPDGLMAQELRRRDRAQGRQPRRPRRRGMVILGGSGSGKSTLLRLMIGSMVPDSGEIRMFGSREHLPPERARTQRCPQALRHPLPVRRALQLHDHRRERRPPPARAHRPRPRTSSTSRSRSSSSSSASASTPTSSPPRSPAA
jgi:hypothetical protein